MDSTKHPIPDDRDVLPVRLSLQVQEFGRETVVYDEERHKVHILNRTSYFVWKQCDGHTTFGDLMTRLEESFAKTPSRELLQEGISGILAELAERNMVITSTNP